MHEIQVCWSCAGAQLLCFGAAIRSRGEGQGGFFRALGALDEHLEEQIFDPPHAQSGFHRRADLAQSGGNQTGTDLRRQLFGREVKYLPVVLELQRRRRAPARSGLPERRAEKHRDEG